MELADNSPLLPHNSYSDPHQAKNTVFTLSFNPSRPHDVPDSPMQSLSIQKAQSAPDFQENRVPIDEELEESKAESPKTKQKSSKKRKMKDYTQVNILIDQYYKDPSPNQVRMHELAEKTGLSYYQVYKWFWEQKRKFSYKGKKKNMFRRGKRPARVFACVEIILPKDDPLSRDAAEYVRELAGSRLIFFK